MTTRFDFEAQGLDQIQARLNRGPALARATLNDGLRQVGQLFVPAKGTGPLAQETPRVSGKLARSTFFQITGPPGNQVLIILQPAKSPAEYGAAFYGEFAREGTRAHRIRARLKKVLRFEVDDQVVFAESVQHPGTKANPYHLRVLRRLQPQVQRIVNRMGARVSAFMAGRGG